MITELRVRGLRSVDDSGTLSLGPITVIVGKNNTGKSTLLRSIYLLQEGHPWSNTDIRIGSDAVEVEMAFDSLPLTSGGGQSVGRQGGRLHIVKSGPSVPSISFKEQISSPPMNIEIFPAKEPFNLIYPSFSRQWPVPREDQIRRDSIDVVRPDANFLIARVSTMSDPRTPPGREFSEIYRRVLGNDLTLGLFTVDHGQQIGSQIDRFTHIGLEAMGTGVATALNLLSSISGANGKVFLVEEPENDLHPEALKALLDLIVERSDTNQFIITTHSNIVVTRLGSYETTKVIELSSDGLVPPTSACRQVASQSDRLSVLRSLGYDLADLDITDGWLIFEESSAERLCRSFLIPWFAPGLARLQTLAAKGASRVTALAQNFAEMMLFAHLDPAYRRHAWVIVDADTVGNQVVLQLKKTFSSWPQDRFIQWDQPSFELYFPSPFRERFESLTGQTHELQRQGKKTIFADLLDWISSDPSRARGAFEASAASAIGILQAIETSYHASKS